MCMLEGLKTRVQLPPRPPKFQLPKKNYDTTRQLVDDRQKKYSKSPKGKKAIKKAQKKYDEADLERRRAQKRDYMRRKRRENPNYCKWK